LIAVAAFGMLMTACSKDEVAQYALDHAVPGTTIQLAEGVNYGTLVFRAVPGQSHTTLEDIADAWAYNYLRSIENVTIIGAAGATVDQIKFETGALPGDQNNKVAIKNLMIDGVEFLLMSGLHFLRGVQFFCNQQKKEEFSINDTPPEHRNSG
jgi:hypothetical protein